MKRWLLTSGLIICVVALGLFWWLNREQHRLEQLADKWATSDENSQQLIDHSIWQGLLDDYLESESEDGVNRFGYGDLDEEDLAQLNRYLEALRQIDVRIYRKSEQMAYWINLYNALTVQLVLENYPASSIREMGQSKLSIGPWDDPVFKIDGVDLTLNDIEHRILRPIWQDPRIHFAVNCASIGCPNLQPEVFTGNALEELLNVAAEEYVAHDRGAMWVDGTLVLSSIFDWYRSDFADDEAGLLSVLSHYLDGPKAEALIAYTGNIEYQYDWMLNDAEL